MRNQRVFSYLLSQQSSVIPNIIRKMVTQAKNSPETILPISFHTPRKKYHGNIELFKNIIFSNKSDPNFRLHSKGISGSVFEFKLLYCQPARKRWRNRSAAPARVRFRSIVTGHHAKKDVQKFQG
jgi:hypothetical protein